MFECVPNVSEGRDRTIITELSAACGSSLLDVHCDADHNRSVFTLAALEMHEIDDAVKDLATAVAARCSLVQHSGVHPRLGVLDVVPFVSLDRSDETREVARLYAASFAQWWAEDFEVPVFFYDDADTRGRSLPEARRTAFGARGPDVGPARAHPALGATAVGVRRPLVAVNCMLDNPDGDIAHAVARAVRERDGGLAGVRALGFALATRGDSQVSMNLTDLDRTGIETACRRVQELARDHGADVTEVELVGLLPRAELARCTRGFRAWSGLDDDSTIEHRLAAAGRG